MDGIDHRIAALADAQDGVVERHQVLALGVSASAFDQRARTGRLHRRHPNVYAVGHRVLTKRGELKAAELAVRPHGALAGASAARATGLRPQGGLNPIEVVVPTATPRRIPGLEVHRVAGLLDRDVCVVGGLRTTTPMRTLFDLSARLDVPSLMRLLARAETLRLFDLAPLVDLLERHPRRRGRRTLIEALTAFDGRGDETRSLLEADFLELVRRLRLPEPLVNARTPTAIPDFLWPQARLVVEIDSWEHHGSRLAFHADRARNAELVARGWFVMQVTAWMLRHDRDATGDRLRRALRHHEMP